MNKRLCIDDSVKHHVPHRQYDEPAIPEKGRDDQDDKE
ncbi:Uncharacterised protein [Serratia proteamaculans]|nr:Uncharacterised protein [Serratia proteamaculans]CAI2400853.1 Uncharacterised protein [Serratia proteamaculans]SPZ59326.1 Uncharacterised protein [Serratia quinivorans]VEI67965.1 Uncharacterised protein [Serratia quinivorans]